MYVYLFQCSICIRPFPVGWAGIVPRPTLLLPCKILYSELVCTVMFISLNGYIWRSVPVWCPRASTCDSSVLWCSSSFLHYFFLQHAVPSWPGFSETAYNLNQDIMHLGDSFIRLAAMGRWCELVCNLDRSRGNLHWTGAVYAALSLEPKELVVSRDT